jgi:hypothetical protein
LASRGSSYFNGKEIAFSQTKNPIYYFNRLVKKECNAISIFSEDAQPVPIYRVAFGSGPINWSTGQLINRLTDQLFRRIFVLDLKKYYF